MNPKPQSQRLQSLDALRGFDMIWILGAEGIFSALFLLTGWSVWQTLSLQFQHSEWHGLTFYDLIFPLFIFIAGIALGLANKNMRGMLFEHRLPVYKKALLRLCLLCLLGVIYNHGWGQGIPVDSDGIRYASVLMRIGIAWFIGAMIVWHFSRRSQFIIAIFILLSYWVLLSFIPTPEGAIGQLSLSESWNSWMDRNWLPGIRYQNLATDPEGLLSHFPAIVNLLAGAFIGQLIANNKLPPVQLMIRLILLAVFCLGCGYLWSIIFPINKNLWTSSFVLVTVGWSIFLFALFYYVIDILAWRWLAKVFSVIGVNAILLYLLSSLFDWSYLVKSLFGGVISAAAVSWQPMLQLLFLVALQWWLAALLNRHKIFIKI